MKSVPANKAAFIIIGSFIIFFIGFYSMEYVPFDTNIWIEVENPVEIITDGLEIFDSPDASGGKAIRSLKESHKINSYAAYDINILKEGNYKLWARSFWPDACSNSYIVVMDQGGNNWIGNDNYLNVWHWVPGPVFDLAPGKHQLFVWNEEYGSQLDKILLTSDLYFEPGGFGVSTTISIDFQGELPEKLHSFEKQNWSIEKEDNTDNFSYYLGHLDNGDFNFSLLESVNNGDFYFSCDIRAENAQANKNAILVFNYIDDNNYCKAEITFDEIVVGKLTNGKENLLGKYSGKTNLIDTTYNKFSILRNQTKYELKHNGLTVVEFSDSAISFGMVGFGSNTGGIYYDNFRNQEELTPIFQEIFFMIATNALLEGTVGLKWEFHDGFWNTNLASTIMSLECLNTDKNYAFASTGEEYWKDYYLSSCVLLDKGEAGIGFRLQNPHNYYLYKAIVSEEKPDTLQLARIVNDTVTVLQECPYDVDLGNWYRMEIQTKGDSIFAYIDGELTMQVNDRTYNNGKIAFWGKDLGKPLFFDDISVQPNKILDTLPLREYEFEMRLKAGIDFSEWHNSNKIFKHRNYTGVTPSLAIEKKLFEEVYMINKKTFSGNIKFGIKQTALPDDIYGNIYFYVTENNKEVVYKWVVENNRVCLKKNNETIACEFANIDRTSYMAQYSGNSWVFISKGKIILQYGENINPQKIRVAVSYSGPGMGDITPTLIAVKADKYIE